MLVPLHGSLVWPWGPCCQAEPSLQASLCASGSLSGRAYMLVSARPRQIVEATVA